MRYIEIGISVYLVPDKEVDKIDKLLESILKAKGDDAKCRAKLDYNLYLDEVKSDKNPVHQLYASYSYIQ